MKILVTGGCGYIGSHTVVELLKRGYDLVIIDNLENSSKESIGRIEEISKKKIRFVKGDLRKYEDIINVLEGIDAVIHFAAYKNVVESVEKPLLYFENNVIGTYNLLKAMGEKGVSKIVYSSSAAVYGNPKEVPVNEDAQIDPLSPYGRNKYCVELLLKDLVNRGIDSIALRYFNAAGAHSTGILGEHPDVVGNLIPRVYKASKGQYHLEIRGDKYDTRDGTGVRDYVHVSDLADGHVKALEYILKNDNCSEIFNLCSGDGTTVMEIVKGIEKITGRKVDYEIVDSDPSEAMVVTGSFRKAKEILGWEPKRKIGEIIEDVNRWYEKETAGVV
jgi:UDP-glucose 4-epimerase